MYVAIVGSRSLTISNIGDYLPKGTTGIISGGARGIDRCARNYAVRSGLSYAEYTPDYVRYHRGAPLKRNDRIIEEADFVLIFWDGHSRGTAYTIQRCESIGKPHRIIRI